MDKDERENTPQELTTKQNLDQMKTVLAKCVKNRKALGRTIKKIEKRLEGAKRDILIRRFEFELNKLYKELNTAKGKEAWARRMVEVLTFEANTKKLTVIQDGDIIRTSELIHRPFEKLASMHV
jgi:hypothetical protein